MQPSQPRILLVDDSDAQRDALRRTLESAGFAVEEASDGRQTLACATHRPDVIILAVPLPEVDGQDVCRRLKADPATADIPVMQMSACAVQDTNTTEELRAAADDYITQSIGSAELVARVNTWIRVRRAEAGLRERDLELQATITHFKRMERELIEAKELVETRLAQFHATINSMTEGVCFFDANGEAVLVNQAFFRIYGFPPECLPESTRKLFSLSQAYDRDGRIIPPAEWPLYAALRGEVVKDRELRVRRTDTGREVILSHNAAPVRDSSGHVVMAVVTVEDITAMKQAEEALVRSEKLASVGRMAATVAHEINNPLAAVMNTLFLARGVCDLPASARVYLDMADSELQRIAHITRQALGFYREPAAPASTSVAAVMDSAVDLLKSKIKAKHALVHKQYQSAPSVMAIAGELRQVFSNLLANSLDALADSGVVKLRISPTPGPNSGRDWVRVTVADNGRGIDPAVLPHIFEPFFTTKKSVGTGLGLWVSKQIMDKHGGSIRVHSRVHGPRRGTVFSLVLPAEAEAAMPLRAAGSA